MHRMGAGGIFVDTVLVRRRDAFETRAFGDMLRAACPAPVRPRPGENRP